MAGYDDLLRARMEAGGWEGYLNMYGGGHERLEGLVQIASEIEPAEVFWRCVADVWTHDDAPMDASQWEKVDAVKAAVDEDGRAGRDRLVGGEPSKNTGLRNAICKVWEQIEGIVPEPPGPRIQLLYGAAATGTPRLAIGAVARPDVFAYLDKREESEILVLPETVTIADIEEVPA